MGSRVIRLITPLVICFLFLQLPRQYLSQNLEHGTRLEGGTRVEWNYFEFVKGVILHENLFSRLGNLWFLIILMFVSLISYPMIAFSNRRVAGEKISTQDTRLLFS
jgi:hypothetical protein